MNKYTVMLKNSGGDQEMEFVEAKDPKSAIELAEKNLAELWGCDEEDMDNYDHMVFEGHIVQAY